ncbi:hypothetical protein LLG95_06650 [bacterium]|nr:hypothetical protein [bacterium]
MNELARKIAQSDAIVAGTVQEVLRKSFALTQFKAGSGGKEIAAVKTIDLAVVHPSAVLKSDSPTLVNKADAKNPVPWMKMAFFSSGTGPDSYDLYRPTARQGDHKIWFLRHDRILIGHYFILNDEAWSEAKVQEIKGLLKN